MVSLTLDEYTLSSALPECFEIGQVSGESVEVSISLAGEGIYTATLYGDNGVATFYELRQIVEQHMVANGLVLAAFSVVADYGDGTESIEGKYIIFSRYRNAYASHLSFLQSHFLVNRMYYAMPRGKEAFIPYFVGRNESVAIVYDCVFEREGVTWSYRLNQSTSLYSQPSVLYLTLSPSVITSRVVNRIGEDCGTLLSFTARAGSRSMEVFVVEDTPCASFSFRNSYNATEAMFVFGTTTCKTEVSRKEAVSMDTTSFYDKAIARRWEVESVPLSLEEALWFNEFLESDHVSVALSQQQEVEILISDITSEISDSPKDLVRMKFSWRFNDNARWIVNGS